MKIVMLMTLSLLSGSAQGTERIYHGFTLLDPGTEKTLPDAWMLVRNGKIAQIGQGALPEALATGRELRDMHGRFALSGLIDTHAHLTLGPVVLRTAEGGVSVAAAYDPEVTRHNAATLLQYGVTTVRNPGGRADINLGYRHDVLNGSITGPEALTAGLIIDRLPFEGLSDTPSAERPIEAIVDAQADAGVDYVKFYQTLTEDELGRGIARARSRGVRTILHAGSVSWTRAAELGIDSIVHMMPVSADLLPAGSREAYVENGRQGVFAFFEWYEYADLESEEIGSMIRRLAENRVHIDATLVVFEAAFWGDSPRITESPRLGEVHPKLLENWRGGFRFDIGWQDDDYRRARAVWPKVLRLTRMLHEAGVPLSIGTDLGNPWVVPGRSVHREMALHVEAGIPVWAVLRMATSDAAEQLGLGDKTGSLAAGFEADVVFLRGNPLDDIGNTLELSLVLDTGREITVAGSR